jgi:phosphatidylserine decarboxylase
MKLFFLLTACLFIATNNLTAIKLPFICQDHAFMCIGGIAPLVAPEFSVWAGPKDLSGLPNIISIETKRSGTNCIPTKEPQITCSTQWTGSQALDIEDAGFFNQIYVKTAEGGYNLEVEPIDHTAYAALKSAYVQKGTSLLRRAMPGQLTKLLSSGYGYLQEQKNPAKTAQHINELLKAFGYGWNGTSATVIDKEKIGYAQALGVNPAEWIVPDGGYQTFNDFFIHKLKEGTRPITGTTLAEIVSPADSKVTALEHVNAAITLFNVKQEDFTLEKFIGNSTLAKQFNDGTLLIFRLSPYNYHRFNFPVDAIPYQSTYIKTSGLESVDPIAYKTGIDPLIINKRELIQLETAYGTILVIVVGAFNVGTIVDTYKPCELQTKNDELGYFSYGGSTLVVAFKPGAITVISDVINHSRAGFETAIKMGEKIATFTEKYFDATWNYKKVTTQCNKTHA